MRKLALLVVVGAVLSLEASSAHAAFPGANGRIAFSTKKDDPNPSACGADCNWEIYTMNPDGTDVTRLTNNPDGDQDPNWSPDGKKILFNRAPRDGPDAYPSNWYLMNADGTGLTSVPLTMHNPSLSPNGQKVTYRRAANALWTANLDGTDQMLLGNYFTFGGGTLVDTAWSPDGGKIAMIIDQPAADLATVNSDGSGFMQLTHIGDAIAEPNWSPEGAQIVFSAPSGPNPSTNMVIDRDGSNAHAIGIGFSGKPVWSPDRSTIAYTTAPPFRIDLIDPDGNNHTPIYTDPDLDPFSLDWQPGTVRGFPRPKTATPLRASLAVAYDECTTPTSTHGAPLSYGSCAPQQSSSYLTVGTPDANSRQANSTGFVRLDWTGELPIDPNNGNQSDMLVQVGVTDVRDKSDLSDYTGELRAEAPLRITDKFNGYSGGSATVSDTTFPAVVPCASTSDANVGSTCAVSTSANAIIPGMVIEGKRAIWALGQVNVYDGGADGAASTTADNTLFETQGIFVP